MSWVILQFAIFKVDIQIESPLFSMTEESCCWNWNPRRYWHYENNNVLHRIKCCALGSTVKLKENRIRWWWELQNSRKILLERKVARDHLVQPGFQFFLVLFQHFIPAKSLLQSWAAVIQYPELAAFKVWKKTWEDFRDEAKCFVLDAVRLRTSGLEMKHQGLGSCPGEGPGSLITTEGAPGPLYLLEQKLGFSQTQLANFMSGLYILKYF